MLQQSPRHKALMFELIVLEGTEEERGVQLDRAEDPFLEPKAEMWGPEAGANVGSPGWGGNTRGLGDGQAPTSATQLLPQGNLQRLPCS